jgi:hypothetical protein
VPVPEYAKEISQTPLPTDVSVAVYPVPLKTAQGSTTAETCGNDTKPAATAMPVAHANMGI